MSVKIYDGSDKLFRTACELAKEENKGKAPLTKRQYQKYKQGRGLAFRKRLEAQTLLQETK